MKPEKTTNKGQSKEWDITHPTLGTRRVTTQTWADEKLGQAGWSKPVDMPDVPEEDEPPTGV